MPDIKYAKLEEIPEGLREHATQVDGGYSVNVVANARLVEFRDKNVELMRKDAENTAKLAKFGPLIGDNPDEFATQLTELRRIEQEVKDGKLKGTDAVAREVENRAKAVKTELDGKIADLTAQLATSRNAETEYKSKFNKQALHNAITQAAMAADSPINPIAITDVLTRAEQIYQVQADGSIVAKKGDLTIYSEKDASLPMPPSEWMVKLVKEAPHFGKSSVGSGAGGSKDAKLGGISQEAFNKLPAAERMTRYRAANGG